MLNWKSQKKKGATVAYFKVLFSNFLQRRRITKTHQEYQFMTQVSKANVVFFPYALRLDSSLSPSATLVGDFATQTGFSLGMLESPPTKSYGTRATRQVGPTAWHNVATKTLCYLENRASAKPVTGGFTNDTANVFSPPRGGARPWLVKCDLG